jgi:hypothetical protein
MESPTTAFEQATQQIEHLGFFGRPIVAENYLIRPINLDESHDHAAKCWT